MQPKQPSSSGDDNNNNKPSSSWYPQSQDDQAFLDLAIDEACKGKSHGYLRFLSWWPKTGLKSGDGGPFGAVIVLRGKVIVQEHNRVLSTLDPTAHAEVVAIRKACEILQTHQLQDCFLYASCQVIIIIIIGIGKGFDNCVYVLLALSHVFWCYSLESNCFLSICGNQ